MLQIKTIKLQVDILYGNFMLCGGFNLATTRLSRARTGNTSVGIM